MIRSLVMMGIFWEFSVGYVCVVCVGGYIFVFGMMVMLVDGFVVGEGDLYV